MDEISTGIKHALVVYFPGSGRAGDLNRNIGRIIRRLTEEGGYCVSSMVLTDADALKSWVADTRADLIIACGGDGTVRRVLEAVVLAGIEVPVGIIPLGTGNLLAKSLGLVDQGKIDKVDTAMDVILSGRTASMDLGRCNGRIFAIDVGVGPLANAVISPTPGQKSRLKMFAYLRPFLQSMSKRPVIFDVTIDGQLQKIKAHGIFITNERDMGLTTDYGDLTSLRDGKMDIYVVHPRSLGDWMRVAWAVTVAYFANDIIEHAPYERLIARRTVSITSDRVVGYMLDGDRCSGTPIDVEVLPAAVRMFVPSWARKDLKAPPVQETQRVAREQETKG
jgi:diacylglycerol kinase family enzyme